MGTGPETNNMGNNGYAHRNTTINRTMAATMATPDIMVDSSSRIGTMDMLLGTTERPDTTMIMMVGPHLGTKENREIEAVRTEGATETETAGGAVGM